MGRTVRHAAQKNVRHPYAVPAASPLGRTYPEAEDATRSSFQRDRDRIIHAQSFRRLLGKTQVFASGHGDHYRTRITHTLEVAQISRDIARTLGVNEDLSEAIALAHDLGHTPFGHAGEEQMRLCMEPFGKSFEHNEQSLRTVTVLEVRSMKHPGLNLCRETLEGLIKHRTPHDHPAFSALPRSPSLEGQIVNLADEIAYTAHDTDDAIRGKFLTLADLAKTALGSRALVIARQSGTEVRGAIVHLLVTDLYRETHRLLTAHAIRALQDVYDSHTPLVNFGARMREMIAELRDLLWRKLYLSASVQRQARRGKRVIRALFHAYMEHPPRKVTELMRMQRTERCDAVKDFIAGMTDRYALEAWEEL